MREASQIIDGFFSAISNREFDDLLKKYYAVDAKIWHNTDNYCQTPQENVASIRSVEQHVETWSYDLTKRIPFDGGLVQEFTTQLAMKSGKKIDVYVCGIFEVADGRITSLKEYYDAASLASGLA